MPAAEKPGMVSRAVLLLLVVAVFPACASQPAPEVPTDAIVPLTLEQQRQIEE